MNRGEPVTRLAPLPIDAVLPDVERAARAGNVALAAPTGAGKTTRVPRALLDAGFDGTLVLLEPRRVAARAAAARIAEELGEDVGGTVGFQVRFERRASARTRILVVTEGVLLRRLVADPLLEGVGVVLLDEIHERGLDADLVLALARHAQREVRPDLRLVAMSATLDLDRVAAFLDATPIRSEGRSFPVEVRYAPRPDDRDLDVRVADGVLEALRLVDGDVLAFLPGAREIRETAAALAGRVGDVDVVPLHGTLPPAEQDRALKPGPRRRVVLATNVAETSVTIPSVRAVVDAGLARVLRHDPSRGLDRLVVERISRASADQRAGRAGRVAPGVALRLWTERAHAGLAAHETAEVHRVDLAGPVLALLAWGEPDVAAFPWYDAPPRHALDGALALLRRLGAVDERGLTATGRAMARLPAHPRLARLLVEGHRRGVPEAAAEAAALLSDRLPFSRDGAPRHTGLDDLEDLVEALHRGAAWGWTPVGRGAVERTREAARQLAREAARELGAPGAPTEDGVRRALLAAWPDRVAARRGGSDRLLLASGRGARLHASSSVREAPWLVALDVVDTAEADAVVHLATAIDPGWLDAPEQVEVVYDPERDRVVATRRARYGALVLREQPGVEAPADAVHHALATAIRADLPRALPDDRDDVRLLARLRFLARARPDLDLPPVDDAALAEVAVELAHGRRSLAEVRRAAWSDALLGRLTWPQRQQVDALAPDRLEVPSGSLVRLEYPDDGPPILAVRIQEMFGLATTPKVAGVAVLLHLLAPNQRPQQITDDLGGFWTRAWPEVRKELRGRYPKHAWPDDPLTAAPEHRPRRPR